MWSKDEAQTRSTAGGMTGRMTGRDRRRDEDSKVRVEICRYDGAEPDGDEEEANGVSKGE